MIALQPKLEELGKVVESDVLVIGGGIGGWCCAISAKESGLINEVVLVEKSHAGRTGPSALVGGIFSIILPEDDPDAKLRAFAEGKDYLADQETLAEVVRLAPEVLKSLEKWGVKFMKRANGKYETIFQRGGNTILMEGGGIPMMDALTGYGRRIGIRSIDWTMITDLLVSEGNIVGAVGINCRTGEFLIFKSKTTVLATGGTIFKSRSSGHRNTTGDGWAMAYRAGAEMMGFHFSTSNVWGATSEVGPGNGLLLSEGARLLNNKMEEYVKNYPEIQRLKSPEWHSPLMAMEAKRGNAPPIWLDLRHFTEKQVDMIYRIIPYAAKKWEKLGFLKEKRFIKLCEYTPEGPNPGGGVFVTPEFASRNIRGLFACGEAVAKLQCGGGLNRAAISGVIAGWSAARTAADTGKIEVDAKAIVELRDSTMASLEREDGIDPENALVTLQEAIHPYPVHILRRENSMRKALDEVERIRGDVMPYLRAYDPHYLRLVHELRNMVLSAEMFLKSALEQKESRFGSLREDYPYTDNINWLKWLLLKEEPGTGTMKLWTENIPLEKYKFRPKREKFLHPFWARAEELGYWKRSDEVSNNGD
ncbi:MAG: FAD-binding protein [Chloroflexi bacterium]|nr:FAD-binding protein [Chloroflexota bacterium]